ncbi:hypothetical protein Acr_11g0014370 [Actinidia rufa]|uniref:Uncharacterized protein n=1 Tax=Actinidia rufa TaxID=165716 RepID=A0A7J0FEK5_9ERIC|nr:hypothetical protein Acr_11g0014370 [Actinidia rufa]
MTTFHVYRDVILISKLLHGTILGSVGFGGCRSGLTDVVFKFIRQKSKSEDSQPNEKKQLTINYQRLRLGMGAVRKYSAVQVTFCHLSSLGIIVGVAPRPSFQCYYYSELDKKWRLEGNDGLNSGGYSSVAVTSPSSGTEGLRARSVATVGRDLCPARPMSNGVRTEFRRKVPTSSLCSGSSSRVPALARSGCVIVR